MKPELHDHPFRVSQTIYGRLLRAYPQVHRAAYGAAMAQLFRDQCRDAWQESRNWGLWKLWLRTLPDLACTSILERLAALKERKNMTDKLANLFGFRGAPAAAFFGVFIPVFLLVFIASVVITFILPEAYASTARIKVESDAPAANGQAPTFDPYFIQTTFEIIQSPLVLNPVIDKLKLNDLWGKKYLNGQNLKTTEAMEILRQRLQLAPVRNTKLISITVFSEDKNEAAQIANAIAESYKNYRAQTRVELMAKGMARLNEEYANQEEQIQKAQSDAESLRQKSPQEQRDLSGMLDLHKLFLAKIEAEKMDAQMPQLALVQITDTATPGFKPVRPNKTLNIVIGAVAGVFLAAAAGTVFAVLAFYIGKRKNVAAT